MLVVLKANWFVEGRRIRCGVPPSQPVEVADRLRSRLPSSARVVEEGEVAAVLTPSETQKTFSGMARSLAGRKSLVDYLGSNPEPKPEPVEAVEPPKPTEPSSPEPEVELEQPEPDIKEVLKAAKAVSGKRK